MFKEYIEHEIAESKEVKNRILNDPVLLNQIDLAAKICVDAYKNGNKILFGGNGGDGLLRRKLHRDTCGASEQISFHR